jgi:hypothetical protein
MYHPIMYLVEEKINILSLISYKFGLPVARGGGGHRNTSPPHHYHPISKLILGYFIQRRRKCYSTRRCFLHDNYFSHHIVCVSQSQPNAQFVQASLTSLILKFIHLLQNIYNHHH